MIIKCKFSNFYSFADETEISFELGKKPSSSAYDVEITSDRRINKVIAVVGPNGSGKTQLIKPLAFISWFICNSFLGSEPEAEIPFEPHAFKRNESSSFEITFRLNEGEYRYILEINRKRVIRESLHRKTSHLFSYIFVRELIEKNGEFSYRYKQQGFGFSTAQAKNIRGNASLISAAHNFDVKEASEFIDYYDRCSFNLSVSGRQHFHGVNLLESAEYFHRHQQLQANMQNMLCGFDLGLSSVKINETEAKDQQGNTSNIFLPIGVHQSGNREFELSLFEESSGTQSAFVLLRRVLPVLANGGIAIIDEIDNDLHPHMLPHIMDLFKFNHSNPHQAQLIFTCHTPEVLNLLKKHQVYLVEKQEQKSEAWRLDEVIGLRADDNLYAKYMAGALSAVPDL